jgi:protein gp37
MGERTGIEWTHHTWSPWHGCTKVSPGCANCYAERQSTRYGHAIWGSDADRRFFGEHHWNDPLRWNRAAQRAGERRRVFPSMCDPFEDRPDLVQPRARMFDLIDKTPWLDWLLCTKRPENVVQFWPEPPTEERGASNFKRNIWLLASTEDQDTFNRRVPALLNCHKLAPILGLSIEPMLGPIHGENDIARLDWVILGGESQIGARAMNTRWAQSMRDQCQAVGTPFYFKQWGEWLGALQDGAKIGNDQQINSSDESIRVGKRLAGCLLDGREWKQFPVVPTPPSASPTPGGLP